MSEEIDALLAYMSEAGEQARHHEQERSSFTNAGLGFAGAIATGAASAGTMPLLVGGIAVTFLGLFGLALSLKSYERNRFHVKVFELTRKAVDAAVAGGSPAPSLTEIRTAAERGHKDQFRTLGSEKNSSSTSDSTKEQSPLIGIRLNRLWLIAWLLVSIAGIGLAATGGLKLSGMHVGVIKAK